LRAFSSVTPEALIREGFLAEARGAVVLDDGTVLFDLAQAKYSISAERNKCLLHLWSEERNLVRRVLDVEVKKEVLRLAVQRLRQTRPSKLEICRQRDRRTPTAKRAARLVYQRSLQALLERRFSAYQASRLTTCVDLERFHLARFMRGGGRCFGNGLGRIHHGDTRARRESRLFEGRVGFGLRTRLWAPGVSLTQGPAPSNTRSLHFASLRSDDRVIPFLSHVSGQAPSRRRTSTSCAK
jgi:hypothetical protein